MFEITDTVNVECSSGKGRAFSLDNIFSSNLIFEHCFSLLNAYILTVHSDLRNPMSKL